ncbi:MAG: xanthine dehydrogenase family protein subunit M [Gammaproteobacteria bacterium]|jgi:CO/xanthine dehydrogenase FAD-binding subunit|nr:xanthine dehydrogenase family protein subunit M [Gammaproteobacteria bacterium]
MHDFEYCAPDSLKEAIGLMATHKSSARLLAGGTDLIVLMRARRKRPELVIDAKHIPELTELKINQEGLSIGASVSCRTIYENDQIAESYPALVDSTSLVGGIQVQGRASIGGNLCNAAPSADSIPTLMVLGAIANVVSDRGERQIPVEEFCVAPGQTVLEDDEILVNVTVPAPAANSGARFLRFIPRNEMDIAVANSAAYVELDETGKNFRSARIAIGAVAPTPLFVEDAGAALTGKPISEESILNAAVIARDAARPINDMRGTVEHRLQLVETLTKRVLNDAVKRAIGEKV